jgi:dihydroflavonol-4-reductase
MQGVEVVFHAAALLGVPDQPGRAYSVTVEGTRAVLAAAREVGVRRLVHTSSVATLGVPQAGLLMTEENTWNYRADWWTYGYAKYLAEMEVQKAVAQGLDAVIVNPAYVLGPGDVYRQTSSLIVQVANGRLPALVEGGLNIVHVKDVTAGHLAALQRGRTGERYLLGGENMTIEALVQCIARVAGVQPPAVVLPGSVARQMAGVVRLLGGLLSLPVSPSLLHLAGHNFWLDTQKAQLELGLEPPLSAEEAVRSAYDWFVEVGAIRRSRSSSG